MNQNDHLHVAYLDVGKAYDTVDRGKLVKILSAIKAPPEVLDFVMKADEKWFTTIVYKGSNMEL